MAPGSMPSTSTELIQEGIIIPCVKLYEKGVLNQGLLDLVLRNVRTPDEREGDLKAQIAAAQLGQKRIVEVIDKIGLERWHLYKDEVLNYSERLMRAKIREKLPQGSFSAELYIDDDGYEDRLIKIAVTVTINGDQIHVDFSGTDPERRSGVNTVPSNAVSAAYYVVKGIVDPSIPVNSGCYRPIKLTIPPKTDYQSLAHGRGRGRKRNLAKNRRDHHRRLCQGRSKDCESAFSWMYEQCRLRRDGSQKRKALHLL